MNVDGWLITINLLRDNKFFGECALWIFYSYKYNSSFHAKSFKILSLKKFDTFEVLLFTNRQN